MKTVVAETNCHLSLLKSPIAAVPYAEYLKEREQILKHKWILSENAGRDVGFEVALMDWVAKHRNKWVQAQRQVRGTRFHAEREQDSVNQTSPQSAAA